MPDFPDCFPKNFQTDILPKDAIFKNINVYRILTKGVLNRDAFLSSFEENPDRFKRNGKENKPGTYSTSCFEDRDQANNVMEMTLRPRHPKASMSEGITSISCGPCKQSDKEGDSHVHWWIYKDAHPEQFFKEVQ